MMKTVSRHEFTRFLRENPHLVDNPIETVTRNVMQYCTVDGRLVAQAIYRLDQQPQHELAEDKEF